MQRGDHHDDPRAEDMDAEPRHAIPRAVILGLLGTWATVAAQSALPVEAGEPPVLRWLRLAAEHPARLAVALSLLVWALAPGRILGGPHSGKEPAAGLSSRGPFSGNAAHPQAPPHRSPWPKS